MDIIIHLNERAEKCWKIFMGYRTGMANAGAGLSQSTMKVLDDNLNEFKRMWSDLGTVEQTNIKLLAIRELMYLNHCGFKAAAAEFDTYTEGAETYI